MSSPTITIIRDRREVDVSAPPPASTSWRHAARPSRGVRPDVQFDDVDVVVVVVVLFAIGGMPAALFALAAALLASAPAVLALMAAALAAALALASEAAVFTASGLFPAGVQAAMETAAMAAAPTINSLRSVTEVMSVFP
jgi:hypothetical protein